MGVINGCGSIQAGWGCAASLPSHTLVWGTSLWDAELRHQELKDAMSIPGGFQLEPRPCFTVTADSVQHLPLDPHGQTSHSTHLWGLCDVQQKEGITFPVEGSPGTFNLAVTNPGGTLWGAMLWDGRAAVGQTDPQIPFGGAPALAFLVCKEHPRGRTWTKSCIFWAGSTQSRLVLCLTPKSHGMASFIPVPSQPGICQAAELLCVLF